MLRFPAGPCQGVGFDLGVIGGIVDENVDAAETGEDGVACLEERRFGGDVGCEAKTVGTVCGLKLVGAEAGVGGGEVQQNDVGARGGEDGAVEVTEQTGAAGNDGYAAGEVKEGVRAIGERRCGDGIRGVLHDPLSIAG